MRATFLAPLAILAATFAGAGSSLAAPFNVSIEYVGGYYGRYQPRDHAHCHNFTKNHYVPEWGITIPHHHSQRDCRPIRDENDMESLRNDRPWNGWYRADDDRRYRRHHGNRRH